MSSSIDSQREVLAGLQARADAGDRVGSNSADFAAIISALAFGSDAFASSDEGLKFQSDAGNLREGQTPFVTLLSCADSRVPRSIFSDPFGKPNLLFAIRNIGNQYTTAAGSVKFACMHLKTPVCVVLGHTGCGAVKAAASNYVGLDVDIQREILSIVGVVQAACEKHPETGGCCNTDDDVPAHILDKYSEHNVDSQVYEIVHDIKLAPLIARGELLVIGAVFDVRDAYNKGAARVHFVNVNGETEITQLRRHKVFSALQEKLRDQVVSRLTSEISPYRIPSAGEKITE